MNLKLFVVPSPVPVQHPHPGHQWQSSTQLMVHSAVKSLESRFSLSSLVGLSLECFFSLFRHRMCRYVKNNSYNNQFLSRLSLPIHHCRCWIDTALRSFLSQSCVSLASLHSIPLKPVEGLLQQVLPPRPLLCRCLDSIALLSLLVSLSFSCRWNLSEALRLCGSLFSSFRRALSSRCRHRSSVW